MKLNLRLAQIAIITFGVFFTSVILFEQSWAQEPEPFGEGILKDPTYIFNSDQRGFAFFVFIIGIAIYALFVWYFYRFISKRDLFPKIFYKFSYHKKEENIFKIIGFAVAYIVAFPVMIFVWFVILAFFVFLIGEDMPFRIAIFVSMAIIGVVRILSYYKEDAAKEVAKMIPYAILSFLLTSAAVYANPNFFTEKSIQTIPMHFINNFEGIVAAIMLISTFEFSFRIAFMVKRRFLPVSDKILEEEIESEVESIAKAHFKKMEDQQTKLENRIEELQKKLDDSKKSL